MSGSSIEGIYVGMNRRAANVQSQLRQDEYANLIVSQGLPKYTDLVLNGKMYSGSSAAGTARAPVAALPTTAAAFGVYNGSSGSIHLIMIKAYTWLVAGTKGLGSAFAVAVDTAAQGTALTLYSGALVKNMGPTNGTAAGIFVGGATMDNTPGWAIVAAGDTLATNSIGPGFAVDLDGLYIVPPGGVFAMSVIDEAGSVPLYGMGCVWAEVNLDTI